MKKKDKKSEFFELLQLNSSDKLKKWLISHGKSGKPTCPIMFVDKNVIAHNIKEEKSND